MLNYENFIAQLHQKFPEFQDSPEMEGMKMNENLPYFVIIAFKRFFGRMIAEKNEKEIKRISLCLDEMESCTDEEIQNLLYSGFFESINPKLKEDTGIINNLSQKLRKIFKKYYC